MDVVFLHGWLMGPELWDAQVASLDGIATPHALAAPAHGTPAPPDGFTMAAWAAQVMGELDRRSVDRAVFVGHSMGGWLTQQIWRDYPERVLGMGLVGIAERSATPNERKQFKDLGRRIASQWRVMAPTVGDLLVGPGYLSSNPGWFDRWVEHIERNYDLAGMAPLIAAINGRPDYSSTTSRIDVPTTVIHGIDDRVMGPDFGRRLAAKIAGADLVEVEGSGHAVPMEQPAAVSAAIRALVDRVTVADSA